MNEVSWIAEFPAAITVSDAGGKILAMNRRSCETFAKDGGEDLVGKSLYDCHPEPARSRLAELLGSPSVNCYTIEKGGIKKLIYQAPWFEEGAYRGMVEISLPIPREMRHFVRE